jgi:hypothetical protein
MKKLLEYTKIFLFVVVLLSLVYSIYSHIINSDPKNIPILKDKSQLSSDFVRVNITKVEVLPISLETSTSKKRFGITTSTSKKSTIFIYVTSDNQMNFITPITKETIEKEKIEVGSTAIFGADSSGFSQVEKNKDDLFDKIKTDYPNYTTQSILYFQGKKADILTSYKPFLYIAFGSVIIFWITYKYDKNNKSKQKTN